MSELLLAAVTREDVARFVSTLFLIYIVLIFIRVLMSWFTRIPYNRFLDAFLTFVTEVTDPFLNLFRRIIPMARIGPAALDLSPIIATFVLLLVGGLVVSLIEG